MRIVPQENSSSAASDYPPPAATRLIRHLLLDLVTQDLFQTWAATLFATFVGLRLLGHVEKSNVLWPVSGVAMALVLPAWHLGWSKRLQLVLAAATGFWTAAWMLGMPWQLIASITTLTCMDVGIGAWMLSPTIKQFSDLKDHVPIFRFLLVLLILPVITGSLGTYPVASLLHQPVAQTWLMILFSNSLGIAITFPAALLLLSPDRLALHRMNQNKAAIFAIFVLFLACTTFVFWQIEYPLLFMAYPPMMLLIFSTGLEGSVAASVLLSMIGWIATSHGHGPIMLVRGGALLQLLIFQAFIWISVTVTLPVGALVDERRRAEHLSRESASIYSVLLQHAEDCIILSGLDGGHRYVSPAVTRLAGWSDEEYLALERLQTFHPDDREAAKLLFQELQTGNCERTMRYRMLHKSGQWKWVQATFRPYGAQGESIAGYVKTIRDISEQIESERVWQSERHGLLQESKDLATMANTDPLTGLLNRRGLDERVAELNRSSRGQVSLLMIDIDFFKRFNDTYGHQTGDDCLVTLAKILIKRAARAQDIVARFGGEEFTVVLFGTHLEGAARVAELIRSDLRASAVQHAASPFNIVTISIGTATDTGDAPLNVPQLIEQADKALYISKQTRDTVTAYS